MENMSVPYLISNTTLTAYPAINNERFQCFIYGSPPGGRTVSHQVLMRVKPAGTHHAHARTHTHTHTHTHSHTHTHAHMQSYIYAHEVCFLVVCSSTEVSAVRGMTYKEVWSR